MFWERLTINEQNRYWEISQRMKKYIEAILKLPISQKNMDEWTNASFEKREEICRREERKTNHFIRNPDNWVHYDQDTIRMDVEFELDWCQFNMINSVCTDDEIIEADRLASKGWNQ